MVSRRGLVIAQHKPFSFLSPSSSARGNKRFAIELLNERNRCTSDTHRRRLDGGLGSLRVAGRLDADSSGLMLWTDDRSLAERVIGPASRVEKEYVAAVSGHELWDGRRKEAALQELRSGRISLDGAKLRSCGVEWVSESELQFTLTEGKHRQIRRMCEHVALEVNALHRVRIGGLELGSLGVGMWKVLDRHEVGALFLLEDGPAKPQRSALRQPPAGLSAPVPPATAVE